MKYKFGDVVTIRKDLNVNTLYQSKEPSGPTTYALEEMLWHKGKKATVKGVSNEYGYSLDIDDGDGGWVDEMFEEEKPKTTLIDSIIIDIDRLLLKLNGLLKDEKSNTRRAMIKEIIVDMKVNKKLL